MYTFLSYSSFLYCYRPHPYLLSFPTRRSSDLEYLRLSPSNRSLARKRAAAADGVVEIPRGEPRTVPLLNRPGAYAAALDRKSTRLNSSHRCISYAVFCLKKKKRTNLSSREATA